MKQSEIWQFVKLHTQQFEQEKRLKATKTVKNPCAAYKKTAAINLQSRPGFDQDKVIQERTLQLGNYIIQVELISNSTMSKYDLVHG